MNEYKQQFLGACAGIGLYELNGMVIFQILVEDDGAWFKNTSGFSAFWMNDLQTQLDAAMLWIKENCEPDKWGWKWK